MFHHVPLHLLEEKSAAFFRWRTSPRSWSPWENAQETPTPSPGHTSGDGSTRPRRSTSWSSPTCDEPSTRYRWFSTVHSNHSIPTVHSRFQQLWLEWWCSPTLGKGRWLDFTHPTCDFFRDVWSKMGWTHRNSAKDWSTHRKLTEPLGLTSLARLLWGVDQQEGL